MKLFFYLFQIRVYLFYNVFQVPVHISRGHGTFKESEA